MGRGMQPSPLTAHRRLDELVLEALSAHIKQLPSSPRPSDSNVSIEVVMDDELEELASTTRFKRVSAPYDVVEIDDIPSLAAARTGRMRRRSTFAKTIPATRTEPMAAVAPPASETASFDKVWFEQPEDVLAAIEEAPRDARKSWWWLAVSLAAAAAVVTAMAVYVA